jgi:CSLREA domain-containing protein
MPEGDRKGFRRALALLVAFIALFAPSAAAAATIDVEIFTDEFNNNGNCSLREAVQAANLDNAAGQMEPGCTAGTGVGTITVHAGTPYTRGDKPKIRKLRRKLRNLGC